MSYRSLVTKKRQYKYSANICFDMKDEEKLADFIPNITTTEILREYLMGIINQNAKMHSRILYGSYGTGKSHLLTVLSDLLGHINTDGKGLKEFLNAISKYDKSLAKDIQRFVEEEKPYLVVPIYANFDAFDKCITFSLKKELERNKINICFKSYFDDALILINKWKNGEDSVKRLEEICASNDVNLDELCRGLESYDSTSEKSFAMIFKAMTFGAEFVSEAGNLLDNITLANDLIKDDYRGIVFVFDEFGRYIEDAGENIRVKDVQDIAEFCDHSDYDDYLILVSHKQLSLYTDKMKKSLSDEWKKIEGRFKSTSINIKYDQCLSLIPHIIPKTKIWNGFKKKFQAELNEIYNQAYDFKGFLIPPEVENVNPFEGGFPLHPITLYALDRLSKKVAQNERTFFTYLASDEDNSLFTQLEKMDENEFHFVGLDAIYDYFEENICSYRTGEARDIYKKYQFAINKLGNTEENSLEIKILKVIAVIYIIGDAGTLAAEENTIVDVIDDNKKYIQAAINNLEKRKIIKYMRQYGYYDFLDSSIYDFDTMIEERIPSITDEAAVSILNEEFSNFVMYPYDYNYVFHMNRIFLPVFAQKSDFSKKTFIRMAPKYYDGIAAFVLDSQFELKDYENSENIPERTLLIVNQNATEILNEIKRYVATKYFFSIREELMRDDPTVEKELTLYLDEQRGIVEEIISRWKNIDDKGISVIAHGRKYDVNRGSDLCQIASEIMMNSYPDTIIVNNDLINKNFISGAIKQARGKALSYIMNDKNILDNCSLLSPEHSVLRSVLSKNGIYPDDTAGVINKLPSGRDAGELVKLELDKFLERCVKGQVSFFELYDKLKKPPYGLRDGYIPVLLAYELKQYENISIYFHGSEHDYCEDELLKALENPEDYNLYICDWTQEQLKYICGLEEIFSKYIDKSAKNRLKELFAAMNKHFVAISKAARTTERYVSDGAKHYREIMSVTYKDYNRFFFETLPNLNGDMQELVFLIKNVIFELENVINLQIDTLEKAIRTVLDIDSETSIAGELTRVYEADWKEKRFKSFDFQTSVVLDFLGNMNPNMRDDDAIQELGKIVTGFEIEYWNDSKVEDFYEAFSKMVAQLNNYVVQDTVGSDEIKITISTGDEEEKITQFNKTELSANSQMMFNKMKATIENFGESISYEEKMQVLTRLFSEIM
ncbi:hypothetical protein SAMN05421730_101369 [Anaerobium acetethylicum]|uniref:Uncharacterized protein n=2 Tax=Anaerobium acetethylicum TaxID=1619234 RepID=A0A1D3TUM9_9FIRM|nr:hypothetical protein SAMN05421730_101369 [Anaerobium acetethylicum]